MTRRISHRRLTELLSYAPETGVFTWRVTRGSRAQSGSQVGSPGEAGHLGVMLDGVRYLLHRLAWFYMTRRWPKTGKVVDHINRSPGDNSWGNLRLASWRENQENRSLTSRNRSGFLGVSPHAGKFRAIITTHGQGIYLGHYSTAEKASAAYLAAKRRLHTGCTV